MVQIDRLGWAAGFSFRAYGRTIGIRTNEPAVLDRVYPHLPYGWRPSSVAAVERLYSILAAPPQDGGMRRFNLLYGDWTRLARTLDLEEIFPLLEADMRMFVAEFARRRVFIHAGVVGWEGQAILIPGPSYSGKSTLVAALVKAGARCYSDEYAVVDQQGCIHPFLKPVSLREEGGHRQTEHPVERLDGEAGTAPLPAGLVVLTEYKAGIDWQPEMLSPGQGALALVSNAVAARREPAAVLAAAEQIASRAPVLKGPRGEPAETAAAILRLLSERPTAM